jgi:hypothetical protein
MLTRALENSEDVSLRHIFLFQRRSRNDTLMLNLSCQAILKLLISVLS